ncbi:coiled-coil domain-containing protein 7 isoform X3 [Hyla sarda]|uniref:coiled-coil domain-containing protein 7 isoform X3 n=1 Tax=Hyla sarda TaxID=327740 RepID=UPI0024C37C37|nr:coiled-coil domain-containing protein 7 isoform X3 [Hyla sarda]
MNTTANVKALHTLRQNPSFTTRKRAHLIPRKRKTPNTVEYLPMVLLPPPQAESVQQYAIPLNGSGRVGNSDDSAREIIQICSKIDQYTIDLENIYGKKKGEVPEDSSHVGRQFSAFLSTCDSAATELDTTINVEHKILESLFEGYQKEVQLLEQLGNKVIPAYSDIPTSQDSVTALISRLMEILKKFEEMKHLFPYLPKTHPQGHFLSSPPVSAEEKRGAHIFGPDLQSGWEDHKEDSESLVKALQGLMTDTDTRSKEVLEKIILDVGQLFDAQAMELQKLGKDHKETENKYIKVKANYQALLQEKSMLEMELKKRLTWQANQKSSPIVSTRLEERIEKDTEPVPSTVTASDINHESERDIIFSCGSEDHKEAEECTKLSDSQDKAEVQEKAASPTGSSVSTLHKNSEIQEEKDTEFSEISYTYDHDDLDQGDISMSTSAEPSDPDVVESEEKGQPDDKTVLSSLNQKEVTEEGDNKVIMKKQKFKSLKSRGGRRVSKVSTKAKGAGQAGRKSSRITSTSTPSGKPEDESFSKTKNRQDPEVFTSVSNQRKTGSKLSKIPSSSGKEKAKLNGKDAIVTTEAVVQSHRAKEPADHEQKGIRGGRESRSAGQQQGRQQGLSSKSRRLSEIKDKKLENGKHKDPTGKRQIMKVIPEYQPEKQMTSKKVDADSFPKRRVVNMEGNRYHFTGHSVSKVSGPDQEGSFKDISEDGRSIEEYRRLQPSTAVVTTNLPTHPNIPKPHPDDMDDTRSRFLSSEKIPDKETAQGGNQLEPSEMSDLHFQFYVQTGKYQLPPLEHRRQQRFGQDSAPLLIRQSPGTFDVAALINWMNTHYKFGSCPNIGSTTQEKILPPLLGKNIKLQTKSLKCHSPRTLIQRHKVSKVQADEFPLYDKTFSQSFSTGLFIQGRHISITRSLPTEISSRIPSPTHPRQRAGYSTISLIPLHRLLR